MAKQSEVGGPEDDDSSEDVKPEESIADSGVGGFAGLESEDEADDAGIIDSRVDVGVADECHRSDCITCAGSVYRKTAKKSSFREKPGERSPKI